MDAWSAVAQIGTAAIVAVLAYVLGRRQGRDDERRQWRTDAADVSAEIQGVVLYRFHPEHLRPLPYRERLTVFANTYARWLELRVGLRRIGAGHPDGKVLVALLAVEGAIDEVASAVEKAIPAGAPLAPSAGSVPPPSVQEVFAMAMSDALTPTPKSSMTDAEVTELWHRVERARVNAYVYLDELRQALL